MNNLLLNCILYAILVCPIKRTGSQSVELVLKTCQLILNPNDVVTFEVFVNTTGATQELWPLDDIYLRNSWTSTSCHVNITRDGCGQVNESMCGYCERQGDGGFYLLFPRFQAQGYTYVDSVWEGKAGSKSNYWTFYSYEFGPNAISYKYIGWDTYWSTVYSYLTGGFVQSFVRHELYLPRSLASSFRVGSKTGDFIKVSDTFYIQPTSTLQEDVVFVLTRTNCQFVCGPLSEQFKLEDLRLTFNKTLATVSVVNQYYPAEKVKCQVFSGYIEVYLATSLSWQETACTFPVNETSGQETLPIEIRVFVPFLQSSCRPTELIKIGK
ncbi:hypothetical protein Bpfe_003051 [Biomphalaria pfeifferi]|uniref:Uncharacterized protein n=1 Tax=Biomphalaria pfeifferi TaxID=112525 RepID=A0AAD8C6V9_BIOPF|nr:hypothetical protein Bpfe_003051 [Biomphalaria pfeifferi]